PIDLFKGEGKSPEFLRINPLGAVPVLEIEPGVHLTEVQAILQYLADRKPEAGLMPPPGAGLERYRALAWLSFIATELHRNFYPVFWARTMVSGEEAQKELRNFFRERLSGRWDILDRHLAGREHLLDGFSLADAYLYVVLTWASMVKIDLSPWPNLVRFLARMEARPSVRKAREAEGLPVPA
ncbi:MAG: glutathione binding-like protein, partial [Candidatus Eremiobacterota bacterium]